MENRYKEIMEAEEKRENRIYLIKGWTAVILCGAAAAAVIYFILQSPG